jgi:hypothetical protein
MYCNWLHNDRATGTWALQNGAYDTSTFTNNPNNTFNDQHTRSPGAKFWIPSLDEWIKAAHYDPNRHGPGAGGWWMYANSSDTPPVYAPPPAGGANAGFTLPNFGHFDIPLGSYPGVQSPWGLLDAAGAMGEWTELVLDGGFGPWERGYEGSATSWIPSLSELHDRVTRLGSTAPWAGASTNGFRIASAVPAPGPGALFAIALVATANRRKRRLSLPTAGGHLRSMGYSPSRGGWTDGQAEVHAGVP